MYLIIICTVIILCVTYWLHASPCLIISCNNFDCVFDLFQTITDMIEVDVVVKILMTVLYEAAMPRLVHATVVTSPWWYTFYVIKPAYKGHLCIRTTFGWSLGWF